MLLSGERIKTLVDSKRLLIHPFNPEFLNPNSYDLTLNPELVTYEDVILDPSYELRTKKITIPENGLVLYPGRLYLGTTNEYTACPYDATEDINYVPMIEGKSGLGRLGLFIHITAGFGDAGYCGCWTLEIHCVQPVRIYPQMRICQIYFHEMSGPCTPYNGSYQNATTTLPSRFYTSFSTNKKKM